MLPEQDAARIARVIEYLQHSGMSEDLLRKLHPTRQHNETYAEAVAYRLDPPMRFRGPTPAYHRRLLFVESEHRTSNASFSEIVAKAVKKFPWPDGPV